MEKKYTITEIAAASAEVLAAIQIAFEKSDDSKDEQKCRIFASTQELFVAFTAKLIATLKEADKDITKAEA